MPDELDIERIARDLRAAAGGDARDAADALCYADSRIAEIQDQLILQDHEFERDVRGVQRARTRADRALGMLRTELQRVARDQLEETRLQFEELLDEAVDATRSNIATVARRTRDEVAIEIDGAWWRELATCTAARAESCRAEVGRCTDHLFSKRCEAFQTRLRELVPTFAVSPPAPSKPPVVDVAKVLSAFPLGNRVVDLPSWNSMLWQHVRQNLSLVGIAAAVIAVATAIERADRGDSHSLASAVLMVAWLPLSVAIGARSVRVRRRRALENAVHGQEQTLRNQVRTELQRALERLRKRLERWTTRRSEEWIAAAELAIALSAEPLLDAHENERRAAQLARKRGQARLVAELSAVRTLRNRIASQFKLDLAPDAPLARIAIVR